MNRKGFAITTIIYGLSVLGVMVVFILMGILSSTRGVVSSEADQLEEELINYSKSNRVFTESGDWTVPKGESGWYRIEIFGKSAGSGNKLARGAYVTGILEALEGETFKIRFDANYIAMADSADNVFIKAANGYSSGSNVYPGGTVNSYCSPVPGGSLYNVLENDEDYDVAKEFALANASSTYNGNENVNYGVCGNGKKSCIVGYPGSTDCTFHGKYLVDGLMIAGVNDGNGKVIITNLANKNENTPEIPRKNKKLNQVSKITVTTSNLGDASAYFNNTLSKVIYTVKGSSSTCGCSASSCTCNINPPADIDDIAVQFANTIPNKNITGVEVKVASGEYSFDSTIYKSQLLYSYGNDLNGYGIPWSPNGIRISAYQPDYYSSYDSSKEEGNYYMGGYPSKHGNYYIIPVNNEALALSAKASAVDDGKALSAEYINGESRQKWSIDLVNSFVRGNPSKETRIFRNLHNRCCYPARSDGSCAINGQVKYTTCFNEYRILELSRFKALSIFYDENRMKNGVSTHETFNSLSRNDPQLWNIISLGDGTYAIKTTVKSFNPDLRSGFLVTNTTPGSDRYNEVYIGYGLIKRDSFNNTIETLADDSLLANTDMERFYLYSLDFSS